METMARVRLVNLTRQIEIEQREPITPELAVKIAKLIDERERVLSSLRRVP